MINRRDLIGLVREVSTIPIGMVGSVCDWPFSVNTEAYGGAAPHQYEILQLRMDPKDLVKVH
jgi:hypothetical protein